MLDQLSVCRSFLQITVWVARLLFITGQMIEILGCSLRVKLILIFLFNFLMSPLYAGEYFVFYSYDFNKMGILIDRNSTDRAYKNKAAIAIRYEYDGPSPLKEALIKYFDGPTEFEIEATGARKAHACYSDDGTFSVECGASKIFKSVRIENRVAYVELSRVPGAYSLYDFMVFEIPLWLTATQFPSVDDVQIVVSGHNVGSTEIGCRDNFAPVCFDGPYDVESLKGIIEDYGWDKQ